MLDGGSFDRCQLRLPASGNAPEVTFDCNSNNGATYTNNDNVAGLQLDWIAKWDTPPDTPTIPSYVADTSMGVIGTNVELNIMAEEG